MKLLILLRKCIQFLHCLVKDICFVKIHVQCKVKCNIPFIEHFFSCVSSYKSFQLQGTIFHFVIVHTNYGLENCFSHIPSIAPIKINGLVNLAYIFLSIISYHPNFHHLQILSDLNKKYQLYIIIYVVLYVHGRALSPFLHVVLYVKLIMSWVLIKSRYFNHNPCISTSFINISMQKYEL